MGRVTDAERRDVARRLRELDYSNLRESLICAYLDALGIEGYEDWVGIAHRLADLIEPSPSCEFWDAEEQECYSVHTARPVDRDALLALADELKQETGSVCGVCMGKTARRIREACGETQDD